MVPMLLSALHPFTLLVGSSEANLGLIQFLVPRVMELAPCYAQAVGTDDVDTARG